MKSGLLFAFLLFFIGNIYAQSPGIIVRPVPGIGATPLNPNGDGFTSTSTNGFVSSDITESEVPYKVVPPAFLEPTSDLLRGPATLYSDLVRQVDGSGFYIYNDGTNLLFRLRLGNIISGSKGYSVLIDTDGKIGNTGAYADPNYQAATTGVNGNPGFELEVVLETNFEVAVYNVDGSSTPTKTGSFGINTNSQISIALSSVTGTPDYFYDFYVPISSLGITASTPLRMVATTVMAPKPAIGGPKSDIYGVDDSQYKDPMKSWEAAVTNTPTYTLSSINSGGGGVGPACTAAPTLNGPVQAGTGVTTSGGWTALDGTKPATATITLYKNGVVAGTTTATSGNTWSIGGLTVANGDVLYAMAQATGESQCLQSANVKVVSCTPANTSSLTGLTVTCSGLRGMEGDHVAGTSIKIYKVTSTGITLFADDATTTYKITYPTSTPGVTWRYDDANGQGNASACSGGPTDLAAGTYMITVTEPGKCESGGMNVCIGGLAAATTPTITQAAIYPGTGTLSGTADANALVRLYTNDKLETTTTANASGSYTFTNLAPALGDVITVAAQTAATCLSATASRTVTCFITSPVITTDNNGNLNSTATAISGKSSEATGSIVTVLENGTSVGTATVQADGTWSLNYTPVATKSYTATQNNGSCTSGASTAAVALGATTVCPSITGTYKASDNLISGTFPGNFTGKVRLYIDGDSIGEASVSNAASWNITVNSNYRNMTYAGGVLTVTAQATGSAEKTDCSSSTTVTCPALGTPSISPTSSSILTGGSVTYNISNSTTGLLYAVTSSSSSTTNYAVSQWGTGSGLTMPTNTFNSVGTYNVLVSAVSFSGAGCLASAAATIVVSAPLPVTLLYFTGRYENEQSKLAWETSMEENVDHFAIERSDDGRQYAEIGTVKATGNSSTPIKYGYNDTKPVAKSAWYRLRTVDIDGKSRYSNAIRIVNETRSISVLSVTPNPFQSGLRVQVNSDKVLPATIRIVDLTGREMYRSNKVLSTGNNTILVQPSTALANGIYVLQLIAGNEVILNQNIQKMK